MRFGRSALFSFVLKLALATNLSFAAPETPLECVHQLLGTDVSIQQAQKLAAEWMDVRGKNIKETLTNPWYNKNAERRHPEAWSIDGIPAHARLVETKERIFRHYATKDAIEAIKRSKVLMSAYMPYVEAAPGSYKKTWHEVTGAFLTTPKSSHNTVGVDAHGEIYYYVDVKIAENIPVIEVERDLIFVIPLKPNVRPWIRKRNPDIDQMVGAVPIEIVGEGRAGR